jgi:hypothetical protein
MDILSKRRTQLGPLVSCLLRAYFRSAFSSLSLCDELQQEFPAIVESFRRDRPRNFHPVRRDHIVRSLVKMGYVEKDRKIVRN